MKLYAVGTHLMTTYNMFSWRKLEKLLINKVIIFLICAKQLHHTNAMFGMISIVLAHALYVYTRANTESYNDLRDKNRGVLKGQYLQY